MSDKEKEELEGELIGEGVPISVKSAFKGNDRRISSVLYFSEVFRLVTSSNLDIRVLDLKTKECEKEFDEECCCTHILKWSETEFLGCCGSVFVYSVADPIKKIKTVYEVEEELEVYQMMRINEDQLLLATGNNELVIISYREGKIVRKLSNQSIYVGTKLLPSKLIPNSFYMNCSINDAFKIKLIDHTEDKVLSVFSDHPDDKWIQTLDSFISSDGKTELIMRGGRGEVYVYQQRALSEEENTQKCLFQVDLESNDCESFLVVSNKYVFVGVESGLTLFEYLEEEENKAKVLFSQLDLNEEEENDVTSMAEISKNENVYEICVCTSGGLVQTICMNINKLRKLIEEQEQ